VLAVARCSELLLVLLTYSLLLVSYTYVQYINGLLPSCIEIELTTLTDTDTH